jgi:hypothetical protein
MSFRSSFGCAALASALLLSCESESSSSSGSAGTVDGGTPGGPRPTTTLFAASIKTVTIEIDYGVGAAPYVGALKDFGDPWNLFNANALAIFDGKKKVVFPRTLEKMQKLDDVTAKNYSNADLMAVAAAHRDEQQFSDAVAFYVVFVDGYWLDETGAERKDILGVSIGDTGIMGLFKPAISTPVVNPTPPPQFVEQLALIHTFGHAVGLVDNGIPVAASNKAHVDTENVHHCTNKQCAMAFAIESPEGASNYGKTYIRNAEAVLIGQECLSDVRLLENQQLSQ